MSMAENRQAVLAAVRELWGELGYGPTYAEIAERAGLSSKSHARWWVLRLCNDGLLQREPQKPRSVRPR